MDVFVPLPNVVTRNKCFFLLFTINFLFFLFFLIFDDWGLNLTQGAQAVPSSLIA